MSDAIVTKSYFDDAQVAFQVWNLSNELLYKLCLEYPSHDADDVIAAKTWLIGRSYAVSLERRSGMSDLDAFYVERVIPTLKSSKLDYHLKNFGVSSQRTTASLTLHNYLMCNLRKISDTNQDRRSFVSKYLHFHCPDHFFIYDSRAVSGIKRLTGKLETLKTRLPSLGSYDPEYADFFERCERLSTEVAAKIGRQPNPRELDNVLLFHYAKSRTSHCTRAFDRG